MRKKLAMMLCLACGIGLLACGGKENSAEVDTGKTEAETTEVSGKEKERENQTEVSEGGEEVVLEFWDMPWGGTVYQDGVQDILKEYTELTGVKFNYTNIAWDNWLQVYLTAVSAGNAPDVSTGGSLLGHRLAAEGAIYNMEDFVKTEFAQDFFVDGAVDTFYADDELVAVPWNMDVRSIYYRKDIFEKEGITELPANWEEFYELCKKLTHDGQYGYVTSGTDNMAYWEYMFWSVNNGGHYLNENLEAEMANDENAQVGEFLRKLYKEGLIPEGAPGYTSSDSHAMFLEGSAAMVMSGPTIIREIKDVGIQDQVGILPVMTSPSGNTQSVGSFNGIFVYNDSEHIQETLDFVKWYSENYAGLWTSGGVGSLPAAKHVLDESYFKEDALYAELIDKIVPDTVLQAYPYTHYELEMDLMDSEQYYKEIIQSVYVSDADVMDILKEGDEDYNAALAEMKLE